MQTKRRCLFAVLLSVILTVVFVPATAFGLDESSGWGVVPTGDVETISVNEVKDVELTRSTDILTYKFTTEEEGSYLFFSSGDCSTMGNAFDADDSFSYVTNYGGEGSNFSIDFYAEKGVTYYLQVAIDEYEYDNPDAFGPLQVSIVKSVLNSDDVEIKYSTKYIYTGNTIKPSVKVTYKGQPLVAGRDYTISCWDEKVGEGSLSISGSSEYPGRYRVDIKIYPKKSVIQKTAAGKKQLTVTMNSKVSKTGGSTYQIAYRQKGNSSWRYITTTAQSKTIKSLKSGKQYQLKVRAYKKVNGTPYYGEWSSIKTTTKIK